MKRNELFPWAAIAAVSFAACEAPADNPPVRSANTPGADSIADAPTADALLALDRQANEAFFKGDAAYFEGLLSDQFVMLGPGGARMDKVATTRMVAGVRCDVKDGWTPMSRIFRRSMPTPTCSPTDGHSMARAPLTE